MAQTIGSLDLNAFSDLHSDLTQYFWFESNASATYGAGAHVTLVPDTSFISNPTGQNILMNTDGFSIRNGLLPMMTLDNDSLDFNTVDIANGTYNTVATFSTTGAIIGLSSQTQTIISNNRFRIQSHSRTFVDIAPNSFSLSRINGNANSFYYHAANYIDDTFQLNPFMAFQQTVTNSGEEIGLIPRIFDVNLTSGQTITLDVEPEFSSGILVHVGTIDAPADALRIMGAYDSNGNALSRDGITASLNTNTGKITFTISSSYSGTINKVLCAVGVHAQYPSFICGGVHDYDKWDYSLAENNNQFVYWSNVIGWTAYPFVVGIGDNRYHTSESAFNKKNGFSVDWSGNVEAAGDYYSKVNQISLGTYITGGVLTSNSSNIHFSIPTGRVFPDGTTISKLTFNIVARASNSNASGLYIVKNASGGTDVKYYDSTASFQFYNGANQPKTLTTAMSTISLQGGTNIYVNWVGSGNYFFSGTSTYNGYVNNQPISVMLTDITATLNIPS